MKIVAMETGLEERHTEHAQTEVGPLEELSDQRWMRQLYMRSTCILKCIQLSHPLPSYRQIELDTIARLESQYILREEQAKMRWTVTLCSS